MTMYRTRSAIALAALFVSLVAALTGALASQLLGLTAADNGNTFTVFTGDTVIVSLKANPSTGYVWRITQDARAHLRPLGQAYHRPEHPMPGAPGRQVFRFRAGTPGTSTLRLEYARPWEHGVPPAATFGVAVTVK